MYKTALAALSLALSFGLLTAPVHADDQQGQGQGTSGQGNNNQDNPGGNGGNGNSGNSGNGNSGNSGSGSGTSTSSTGNSGTTNSPDKTKTGSTTTSTSSATTKTDKPAAAAPAPVYVQTYGKYANTVKPVSTTTMTSTGSQKSTSTTTKTASIGKSGATTTTATTATTTTSARRTKDEIVTLQESGAKKYVGTKKNQWQLVESYITLKPGQEALPLTMIVTNQGYTGINMSLAGSKLASDKDFKGSTLRMQMTGALAAGDNKLAVQTYGPVGANLTWKLTTLKPVITAIKPEAGSTEADITLSGRNFSKVAAANTVMVDGKPAIIKAGTSTSGKEITFNLPKDMKSGKTTIYVSIAGIQSKPIEFNINSAPEVNGVDLLSGPPGQTMTITGKGFSSKDNIVTIGGVPAPVVSSSVTSITVTIPEMYFPQWNQAVVVKAGGIESKGNVKINIQQRVIPNDGAPEQ